MPAIWDEFEHDPRDADNRALRAADRDRDVVRRVLEQAYGDGRLDRTELDERTDRVLGSRTLGELPALIGDLVPVTATTPAALVNHDQRAVLAWRKDRKDALWTFLSASLICWVIWAATSFGGDGFHPNFPWPLFVMLGTGLNLGRVVFMRDEMVERERRRLEKKERKALEKRDEQAPRELDPPAEPE
ncbi:DUF1707 SHOCT-like domain-containing protein [Nocardioides sp. Root140]|uniref:DUF1707 SHOCT-like domain-containing protein n=1 Tax=Nocardioides sp. Root140 TaxID=1736460 RepID=UPI0006F7D918|nr:DUF1707 domain-containing protein [Nocardioides sp. Root140]KQY64136.1 hypothetical protein ASD30_04010 [Nocardioides sp. Root140]